MDILENMMELYIWLFFHLNEKHERVFDGLGYLIMVKSNISDFYSIVTREIIVSELARGYCLCYC